MFNVTYEIVTPESAEHGDSAEDGFIGQNLSLREAIDAVLETRTSRCDGISAAELCNWLTINNGMEYETGAYESRSLHFPDNITAASFERVMRQIENRLGFKVYRA